jgi:hypothetical protein
MVRTRLFLPIEGSIQDAARIFRRSRSAYPLLQPKGEPPRISAASSTPRASDLRVPTVHPRASAHQTHSFGDTDQQAKHAIRLTMNISVTLTAA